MSEVKTPKLSLAASHSATWTVCQAQPGFVLRETLAGKISQRQDTVYNVEGVRAHTVAEKILLGQPLPDFATPDMIDHGQEYAAFCKSLVAGGSMFVEQRVPLWYMAGRKGLVDFVGITSRGAVNVVDYKYGAGVRVSPVQNKQMAIYGRGVIESILIGSGFYDVTDETPVSITVKQPRISGEDLPWQTTWGELFAFTEESITAPAEKILADPHNPALPFAPSDKVCQFCPAESVCTARTKWLIAGCDGFEPLLSDDPPEVLALPDPDSLTAEQVSAFLTNKKRIEKFLESVYKNGVALANDGRMPVNMKMVDGKNLDRSWVDEEAASKLLLQKLPANVVWKKDIITPAQAEKVVKKLPDISTKWDNLFAAQIKPGGKGQPLLVHISDKRESITIDPKTEFKDLTAEGFTADDLSEMSESSVLD